MQAVMAFPFFRSEVLEIKDVNQAVEPTEFAAGDSVTWKKVFDAYPASAGWALTYYFSGANPFILPATTEGDGFSVTIGASASAQKAPGLYKYAARVAKGDECYTVAQGQLTITPDPSKQPGGLDVRSTWRKVYEGLSAVLEAKSTKGYEEMSVQLPNGVTRHIKDLAWNDILIAFHHAERQLKKEEDDDRLKRGLKRRRILTRASIPT